MKIRPVGAEPFHLDRHDQAITVALRNFANTPKNTQRPRAAEGNLQRTYIASVFETAAYVSSSATNVATGSS
jgi:hypothetical protein